jgi:hypothetical protein
MQKKLDNSRLRLGLQVKKEMEASTARKKVLRVGDACFWLGPPDILSNALSAATHGHPGFKNRRVSEQA